MSKLSSDKKFYIILSVVIFFGLSGLGLASWYMWDQRQADKTMSAQEAPKMSEEEAYWAEHGDEQNKKLYDQCIKTSNEAYDKAFAQIPADLTSEQKVSAAQLLAQTRDSQKVDCDRQYKN